MKGSLRKFMKKAGTATSWLPKKILGGVRKIAKPVMRYAKPALKIASHIPGAKPIIEAGKDIYDMVKGTTTDVKKKIDDVKNVATSSAADARKELSELMGNDPMPTADTSNNT